MLPPIGNSNWISETEHAYFTFGNQNDGWYIADAEAPAAQQMLEAAERYRKFVSPNLPSEFVVIGRILPNPRLVVVDGRGEFGQVDISASVPPPILWGHEATVRARLSPYFRDINTQIIPVDFDLPMNPAGAVACFREYFGPTQVAFSRLDEAGQAAFAAELEGLWTNANAAANKANHTLVHNEYLAVTTVRQ